MATISLNRTNIVGNQIAFFRLNSPSTVEVTMRVIRGTFARTLNFEVWRVAEQIVDPDTGQITPGQNLRVFFQQITVPTGRDFVDEQFTITLDRNVPNAAFPAQYFLRWYSFGLGMDTQGTARIAGADTSQPPPPILEEPIANLRRQFFTVIALGGAAVLTVIFLPQIIRGFQQPERGRRRQEEEEES